MERIGSDKKAAVDAAAPFDATAFDAVGFLTVPWGEKRELRRFAQLLDALGNPQKSFRAVHVAGTNGKGSTCAYLDSILREVGYRVGLYTSPSLIRLNERIRIGGEAIGDEALASAARQVAEAERVLGEYGGFDRLSATAFVAFASQGVDFAVLETGLGGRLDATNAADAEIAVLAPIGIDHAHLLGGTVELIAREKCGIIKPGQFVVAAPQVPSVEALIAQTARLQGAKLCQLTESQIAPGEADYTGQDFVLTTTSGETLALRTPLLGRHQLCNASVAALAALEAGCGAEAIRTGIARTRWPARMEYLPGTPDVLIDGAHNPHAAHALVSGLNQLFPGRPVVMVAAIMADKDAGGVLRILAPRVDHLVAVRCTERSLTPEAILEMAKASGIEAEAADSIENAFEAAAQYSLQRGGEPLVLVSGSLYLAGRMRQMLLQKG